jgi:bacteriocin biosynthesis cyclodehydratase domain-containing protein
MLPVHVIEHRGGAILKRGSLETRIGGERALEVLHRIIDEARDGAPLERLRERFIEAERPTIDYLLKQLIERRLLVPMDYWPSGGETPEAIFYWEFGQDAGAVRNRLNEAQLVIVGVNEITREMVRVLLRGGFEHVVVVDYPMFRNQRLFGDGGALDLRSWGEPPPLSLAEWQESATVDSVDCLIATSDHGGLHWMRQWNQFCAENRLDFFPVVIQDLIGYIGPYIIPGETACFECLRARQNSHLDRPEEQRAFEAVACEAQGVVGLHPAMSGAVANVAAMELVNLFGRTLPFTQVASLVELNLVVPRMVARKVLRIPNCAVCRTLGENAPISPYRDEMMPGNRE